MKIVIRAGGVGSRLWPMSRENRPKQFQAILGDSTLLQTTVKRVAHAAQGWENIFISISTQHKDLLLGQLPQLKTQNVILEPSSKNTGPAICLESCFMEKAGVATDAVIATIPSDDFISNDQAFCDLLKAAEKFLQSNPEYIVTPGVKPIKADTGFSYIKSGDKLMEIGEERIFSVEDWVEKPSYHYCEQLVAGGLHYYHMGIYIWKLSRVLELFQKYQPKMLEICRKVAGILLSGGDVKEAARLYEGLEKVSIEGAITDKVEKIAMSVSNRMGWSDVGKWYVLKDIIKNDDNHNALRGDVVALDTTNSLVFAPKGKLVATLGVKDLVIVDTGDALLVANLGRSGEVKDIVEKLKREGRKDYL